MKQSILAISVLLGLILLSPAYGDVTTIQTDKLRYTTSEQIVFSGLEEDGLQTVTLIIRDPSGTKVILKGDPSSDQDGSYKITPIPIKSVFSVLGVYKAIAFTPTQPINDAIDMHLDYDGKHVRIVQSYDLDLVSIGDRTINEGQQHLFIAKITDDSITTEEYSLGVNSPVGAKINSKTGKFIWTPTETQGPGSYLVDIIVNAGISEDSETIVITVNEVQEPVVKKTPKEITKSKITENDDKTKTPESSKPLKIASFVSPDKDPKSYVDRYNNEDAYKQWFDSNYPQYSSIYQAVGLPEPETSSTPLKIAPFVTPDKDPQSYVDRYNSEDTYKQWFDTTYPQYSSIYQAVGLPEPEPSSTPLLKIAPFVTPDKDPQSYVDRYNSEDTYKQWFDTTYPQYSSIYQAVGLPEPLKIAPFVTPDKDPKSYVDRYNNEDAYKQWFDTTYPQYSSIYQAVGLSEPDIGICGNGTSLINGTCTPIAKDTESQTCFLFWCW